MTVPATSKMARRTGCPAVLALSTERLTVNVRLGHTDVHQGLSPTFYETIRSTHEHVTGSHVGNKTSHLLGIKPHLPPGADDDLKVTAAGGNQLSKLVVEHDVLLS